MTFARKPDRIAADAATGFDRPPPGSRDAPCFEEGISRQHGGRLRPPHCAKPEKLFEHHVGRRVRKFIPSSWHMAGAYPKRRCRPARWQLPLLRGVEHRRAKPASASPRQTPLPPSRRRATDRRSRRCASNRVKRGRTVTSRPQSARTVHGLEPCGIRPASLRQVERLESSLADALAIRWLARPSPVTTRQLPEAPAGQTRPRQRAVGRKREPLPRPPAPGGAAGCADEGPNTARAGLHAELHRQRWWSRR